MKKKNERKACDKKKGMCKRALIISSFNSPFTNCILSGRDYPSGTNTQTHTYMQQTMMLGSAEYWYNSLNLHTLFTLVCVCVILKQHKHKSNKYASPIVETMKEKKRMKKNEKEPRK